MTSVARFLPAVILTLGFGASQAHAVPILQLYLEGGTYDPVSETWVGTGSSNGDPFRLWAIGNVDGPGGKGAIYGVKLSAVYDTSVGPVSISITPSTTAGYLGYFDPSAPGSAALLQTVSDGSVPKLGDGSDLPSHGEYGAGRTWQEFALGNFTLTDSPIGDFISGVPPAGTSGQGQINVYEISVTNFDEHPFTIHFDLYDHYYSQKKAKYVFAPFSHDGEGEGGVDVDVTIAPEPASTTLFGTAFLGMLGVRWFNKRRKSNQLVA
jgi:hypothetical protein